MNGVGISLRCTGPQSEHTPSYSNHRMGVNSDAITPQSELCACSSPVAISYPIDRNHNKYNIEPIQQQPQRQRSRSNLNFLTSPPMSKYSQLSTRAVTYSPAAHPKLHYSYTTNNVLYHQSHQQPPPQHTQLQRCYSTKNNHNHKKRGSGSDEYQDDDICFITTPSKNAMAIPNLPSPHYMYPIDSNSENDNPITPFNKHEYSQSIANQQMEQSRHTVTNPTIIIHADQDEIIDIDPNGDDSPLLEMYVIYFLSVCFVQCIQKSM